MIDFEHVDAIQAVLTTLRPAIANDGGDIQFVKYENGIVYVRLHGACVGCPASFYTLKLGVEQALKEKVPGITQVVAVDD